MDGSERNRNTSTIEETLVKSGLGLEYKVPFRITPTTVTPVLLRILEASIVLPTMGLSGLSVIHVNSNK